MTEAAEKVGHASWRWWAQPETKEGTDLITQLFGNLWELIDRSNSDRRLDLLAMRSIYMDTPSDRYESWAFHRERRSRYNLTQGAVDSTHAQIVASRPRPRIVTIGRDASAQRKAVLRQRWIDGEYDRLNAYERMSEMVFDGLLYGTGVLKVSPENGRNVLDRVWCGDLWVDPREERYHRVRTLYQVHAIDRDVLAVAYPGQAKAIEAMPGMTNRYNAFVDVDVNEGWENPHQIGLIEAWRLPINKDNPGRHVIVANDVVLLDEEWTHETFPFVFFRWAPDPQRFWGQGMVERAAGIQSDLNEITEIIQESYTSMVPQFWIDDGASIEGDVDDRIGKVNHCKPTDGNIRNAIMVLSPDVGVGLTQREEAIAGRLLPVLGVDSLGAAAEKPAGLNSGIAIQEYADKTSQRFLPQGRRYEQSTIDLSGLLFYFADQMAAAGEKQTVRAFGKGIGLELIRYEDIQPSDEDEIFDVRVKPGSALPKDPAGRIQTVFDMQALGLPIDPEQMLELIEMPDTEAMSDKMLAGRQLVGHAIDACAMDPDTEPQPQADAFWPREYALSEVTLAIQKGLWQGESPEVLDRLQNLHGQLRSMPDPNAPPPGGEVIPMPPLGGAPMPPQAVGQVMP